MNLPNLRGLNTWDTKGELQATSFKLPAPELSFQCDINGFTTNHLLKQAASGNKGHTYISYEELHQNKFLSNF